MDTIIINTNYATAKSIFNLKLELANTPFNSTTKFCWGENRFVIEHLKRNCWTIAVENMATEEPVMVKYEIHTAELGTILDEYLK